MVYHRKPAKTIIPHLMVVLERKMLERIVLCRKTVFLMHDEWISVISKRVQKYRFRKAAFKWALPPSCPCRIFYFSWLAVVFLLQRIGSVNKNVKHFININFKFFYVVGSVFFHHFVAMMIDVRGAYITCTFFNLIRGDWRKKRCETS